MKFSGGFFGAIAIGLIVGVGATMSYMQFAGETETAASSARGERGGPPAGRRGGYVPVVSMAKAEKAAVARRVEVIGRARALKSVAITAEATGLVEAVNIAPGKRVAKDDILIQIVDDEQEVALRRAQDEFPIAKDNADRFRNLEADQAASAQEYEAAQTRFVQARAALSAAEVAVAQRKLIAPFDGIVGLTQIEAGDYIRAGDPVTTLDDTSKIIVEFAVPQESAGFVNIGQPVSVALTSSTGVRFNGVITGIDSRVNPDSRTLQVEAEVDNSAGRLIPGAVVAVSTTAEGEPAIAVPGLAVQWDRGGAYVWRRNSDGAAERAGVVILQRNDETVLVEGDVKAGDVIVSEGADRVRGGVPLPDAPRRGATTAISAASGGLE